MIIDFDSHLREGYFMDEVYKLEGPYERFRPVKLDDGRTHNTKFLHSLDPISPQGHAAHRHPYIYDPKTRWRGGEVAALRLWSWTARRPRLYALATAIAVRVLRLLGGRDGMIATLPFGREWTRGRYFPAPKSARTFRTLYAARPKRPPSVR